MNPAEILAGLNDTLATLNETLSNVEGKAERAELVKAISALLVAVADRIAKS